MEVHLDINGLYIIFFSSSDPVSRFIKKIEKIFNKGLFSHCGLLIYSTKLKIPCIKKEQFVVIESTMSGRLNDNVLDVCGKSYFGTQFRLLIDILQSNVYKKIAVCKIITNQNFKISDLNRINFYIGLKYDLSPNLLTLHSPIPSIKTRKMFCSELVCEILKGLNLVEVENTKKISPNDIFKLKFINCKLDELIYLKY